MVILVGLRMNDDRMIDPGLADKANIIFHRFPLRLVGSAVVRKPDRIAGEQVDMRFDQYSLGPHRPRAQPPACLPSFSVPVIAQPMHEPLPLSPLANLAGKSLLTS